jgi:hypothetical protein
MLKFVAALAVASAMVAAQIPPAPIELVWEGMFAPPYLQNPQISLSMDCLSANKCYIAGGSNGIGFGIYSYDGKPNGNVFMMTDRNMSLMTTDVAVGGTDASPKGVFTSVTEFGISAALQYLVNAGTAWTASLMPAELVWVSQSVSASRNGNRYIAVGSGLGGNTLMVSDDAGAIFAGAPLTIPSPDNCSSPYYIEAPTDNAWFLIWAAEPASNHGSGSGSSNSNSGSSFSGEEDADKPVDPATETVVRTKANGRVQIIRNTVTKKMRVHVRKAAELRESVNAAGDSKCNYYKGWIYKSTDQGRTWRVVYRNNFAATSFIKCSSATNCVAIAFDTLQAYTLTTVNGEKFEVTYTTPAATQTSDISLQSVGWASATEVWAGGSKASQAAGAGIFWYSRDAGRTWKAYKGSVPNMIVIMSLVFTPDGTGFAQGLTEFKTTQIARYKRQSDYGNFVQSNCPTAQCDFLCQNNTFPQGFCLQTQGGSVKAICQDDAVVQYVYETTSCVGSYTTSSMPVNVCLNSTAGGFFENFCPSAGAAQKSNVARPRAMYKRI